MPAQDLPLTFHNQAVSHFDNIDSLTPQEADLYCKAVTGQGVMRRRLYTNNELFILTFQRAVILNGLHLPTNRADLLDRMLIVSLDRLGQDSRRTLSGVEVRFQAALPSLFGGLLNVLAETFARLNEVREEGLSRMADFHRFGRAAALALGIPQQDFDEAMEAATARQLEGALDDPLARTLLLFARKVRRWHGEAQELFERLVETAKTRKIRRSIEHWPDTASGLGKRLKHLREILARYGVQIERRAEQEADIIEYNPTADAGRRIDQCRQTVGIPDTG